jgi:hypothetical protein
MTPQDTKNLKTGAVVIAGLGLLYLLFGSKSNPNGVNDPTISNPNSTTSSGTSLNAQNVADDLKAAMLDSTFISGTDENAILDTLKYVTPSQFNLVIKAFGKQSYNTLYGNQWNFNPFGDLPLMSLKEWLKSELKKPDYNILKSKYPNSL